MSAARKTRPVSVAYSARKAPPSNKSDRSKKSQDRAASDRSKTPSPVRENEKRRAPQIDVALVGSSQNSSLNAVPDGGAKGIGHLINVE